MNLSWLKLDVNILDDQKIKLIRKMPAGNDLVVMWIGLLCMGMKSDKAGFLYVAEGLPYSVSELSAVLELPETTVKMGLEVFQRYQMVDVASGGVIEIINFRQHQSIDKIENRREKDRLRQAKHREKQKQLPDVTRDSRVTHADVTIQRREEKTRKEKTRQDKKKADKNIIPPPFSLFQSYCHSIGADSQVIWDFYESKGWLVGRSKMKDWQAAVRKAVRDGWGRATAPPVTVQASPEDLLNKLDTRTENFLRVHGDNWREKVSKSVLEEYDKLKTKVERKNEY